MENTEVITMRQLLECGVHFGHQTKRWNPRMKRYIFTARNGIHVIDLQQTLKLINIAYEFVRQCIRNNGTIMFVGTKKQAQEAIQSAAQECDMPFVHHRWAGGTLTNFVTIRQSINRLKEFESAKDNGYFESLSPKERSKKLKEFEHLKYSFEGLKHMVSLPVALFVIDTKKEMLAIREANKLKIPIIGIVDTNADPTEVQYPIPANDDAIRAIKLLCGVIANAVNDGKKNKISVSNQLLPGENEGAAITQEELEKIIELTDEEDELSAPVASKKKAKPLKEIPKEAVEDLDLAVTKKKSKPTKVVVSSVKNGLDKEASKKSSSKKI